MSTLENQNNAAVQIGSLLIIKTTDTNNKSNISTRTLTQNEIILIEQNPNILKTPKDVLECLNTTNQQYLDTAKIGDSIDRPRLTNVNTEE